MTKHTNINTFCVKRDMFFAVTHEIMGKNLSEKDANLLCNKLNHEETDKTYVYYYIEEETNKK
jgi:hypothetical protein